MKLQEKFLPFVDWMDLQDDCTDRNWALRNANGCVEVAGEFAIEFLEWCENKNVFSPSVIHKPPYNKLLIQFKKEKGL